MLPKLEKYELIEEIGHGGMATVYRALDRRLDRFVALKVMHPHLRGAPQARARFTREAKSVARLKHPNILEIYDYSGEDSEEAYIAAELLTGPTLKDYAETHETIPAEIAACFVIELARALSAAHESGIIHRDVKPENVLLHENRIVKLADFGIAQMVDAQSFTATGQILGSPGHMAPEQIEGKECDARTDIFALGTVLYYLACGRLPFAGKNPHVILRRIMDVEFTEPIRVRPSIGMPLAHIIVKALSKDPDDRYSSAEALENALLGFVVFSGIEDVDSALTDYLKDPESVSAALTQCLVHRLTEAGELASKRDNMSFALQCYDRALALDEGNPQILSLIRRIGRRRARNRIALTVGGVLFGVGGIVAGGYAASRAFEGTPTEHAVASSDASHASDAARLSSVTNEPVESTKTEEANSNEPIRVTPDASTDFPRVNDAEGTAPRMVVFRPRPQTVSISIDGSPPRLFGAAFHQVSLVPGSHHIRILPTTECCSPAEFQLNVVPGEEPLVVSHSLRRRPTDSPGNHALVGRFYVTSNVSANVSVAHGRVRGRTTSILSIPIEHSDDVVSFTVTAPGYAPYTGVVRLRANSMQTVRVTLNALPREP